MVGGKLTERSGDVIDTDLDFIQRSFAGEAIENQRILVTGGGGFIGSWICEVLVSKGAMVHSVDDFSTGDTKNLERIFSHQNFNLTKIDVARSSMELKADLILHLASHASPEEYQQHPVETLAANSDGTRNMLELARKNDASLLFASSSEVYGDAEIIPTPESYWGRVNPIGPRSCYDEGKRFGEALCMAYNRAYGIDVRITRIFNTFGPRLRADGFYARALSRFMIQALSGTDVTVYGNGDQTRSFCYVSDLVIALLLAATRPEMKARVVNVGNSQEISILSLAKRIIRIVGSKSKITFHRRPADDPQRRCPDISQSRMLLSWAPRVSLEEGLSKTLEWFRGERS